MEKSRNPKVSNRLLTKIQRQFNRENIIFQQMMLKLLYTHIQKNTQITYTSHIIQN